MAADGYGLKRRNSDEKTTDEADQREGSEPELDR
jgi:hypothetical protein